MHNKKQIKISIILTIFIALIIIFNIYQKNQSKEISQTYFYMGTVIQITIYDTDDTSHLNNISKLISDLENVLSRNIETSEISAINKLEVNTPLKISNDSFYLIEKSLEFSKLSDGYFDISINPLVDLWAIGTEDENIPDNTSINQVLEYIDFNNISLNKDTDSITLLRDNMSIDLGGIAKGYVADKIVEYLNNNQLKNAIINLGGNVNVSGQSPNKEAWNVGIKHPELDNSSSILSIKVKDKSVVTSGIYERYFTDNNKIYHHILNPFTGYPIDNDILGISIISDYSLDGDALSTAMFALGKDKALEIISSLDNIEAIIITNDNNIYITEGLKNLYTLYDDIYKIKIHN